jgi:hypothetical protein
MLEAFGNLMQKNAKHINNGWHPCPQQFTLHESVDDGPFLTHPLSQT